MFLVLLVTGFPGFRSHRGKLGRGVSEAHQWSACHPTSRPEGRTGATVPPVPKGFLSSLYSDSISLSPLRLSQQPFSGTAMGGAASPGSYCDLSLPQCVLTILISSAPYHGFEKTQF